MPRDYVRGAISRGAPLRALRTLFRVGMHAAGNEDGVAMRTSTVAARLDTSTRTVQRDLRDLQAAGLPGLEIDRSRPRGRRLMGSWPNRYKVPRARRHEDGSIVWADDLADPVFTAASGTAQGVFLLLCEVLGPAGYHYSAAELAEDAGIGRTAARDAIRYWREAGWLEVTASTRPDGGTGANKLRLRPPWEREEQRVELSADQRRALRTRAYVTRWLGLRLCYLQGIDPEAQAWDRVEAAVADKRDQVRTSTEDWLLGELAELRDLGVYKGSMKRRHVRASLPLLLDRRPVFEREARERGDGLVELMRDGRTGAGPPGVDEDLEGWPKVLEELEGRVGAQSFQIWVKPCRPVYVRDGRLLLLVPNRYYSDWVRDNYERLIVDLCRTSESAKLRTVHELAFRLEDGDEQ